MTTPVSRVAGLVTLLTVSPWRRVRFGDFKDEGGRDFDVQRLFVVEKHAAFLPVLEVVALPSVASAFPRENGR